MRFCSIIVQSQAEAGDHTVLFNCNEKSGVPSLALLSSSQIVYQELQTFWITTYFFFSNESQPNQMQYTVHITALLGSCSSLSFSHRHLYTKCQFDPGSRFSNCIDYQRNRDKMWGEGNNNGQSTGLLVQRDIQKRTAGVSCMCHFWPKGKLYIWHL